jgi:hypothetical protein
MNQAIFRMGLSTEATSLYILLEHLSDGGATLTEDNVAPMWNGTTDEMDDALRELVARNILGEDANQRWFLQPQSEWD